ncbi:uncharacterized protein LOC131954164 [Physella acuta]|uniref:uncharacterized protein LOC131954164 n=1 Tax=Physella acuta TaxID=109671 RepID=UPI0027DBB05B|nr:uncharacterized protein LOC131954164 [Physella acuta]
MATMREIGCVLGCLILLDAIMLSDSNKTNSPSPSSPHKRTSAEEFEQSTMAEITTTTSTSTTASTTTTTTTTIKPEVTMIVLNISLPNGEMKVVFDNTSFLQLITCMTCIQYNHCQINLDNNHVTSVISRTDDGNVQHDDGFSCSQTPYDNIVCRSLAPTDAPCDEEEQTSSSTTQTCSQLLDIVFGKNNIQVIKINPNIDAFSCRDICGNYDDDDKEDDDEHKKCTSLKKEIPLIQKPEIIFVIILGAVVFVAVVAGVLVWRMCVKRRRPAERPETESQSTSVSEGMDVRMRANKPQNRKLFKSSVSKEKLLVNPLQPIQATRNKRKDNKKPENTLPEIQFEEPTYDFIDDHMSPVPDTYTHLDTSTQYNHHYNPVTRRPDPNLLPQLPLPTCPKAETLPYYSTASTCLTGPSYTDPDAVSGQYIEIISDNQAVSGATAANNGDNCLVEDNNTPGHPYFELEAEGPHYSSSNIITSDG